MLKDVFFVVVYGVKVVNGVIIVMIKKGCLEKFVINFSVNIGFVIIGDSWKVYDFYGYLKYCEDFYMIDIYGINV